VVPGSNLGPETGKINTHFVTESGFQVAGFNKRRKD
jgi:hypothetical protein